MPTILTSALCCVLVEFKMEVSVRLGRCYDWNLMETFSRTGGKMEHGAARDV